MKPEAVKWKTKCAAETVEDKVACGSFFTVFFWLQGKGLGFLWRAKWNVAQCDSHDEVASQSCSSNASKCPKKEILFSLLLT